MPLTLGGRLQRVRVRKGLSVRELADRAGLNKDTIVKLDKGNTPTYRTLCSVCDALGVTVVQLLKPEADAEFGDEVVAVHSRRSETRVPRSHLVIEPSDPKSVRVRSAEERQLVAADDSVLLSWLACRLPGGKLNSWLLELRDETVPTNHAGEEFVFCLRGSARLTVAGRSYELEEGDAATFWSAEIHSYAPSERAVAAGDLPVLLLSVWISAIDSSPK